MKKEYSISKNTIEFTCLNVSIKEINEAFKRNKENALEIEDFYLYNIFTGISVKERDTLFAIDGGVLAQLQKNLKSKTLMEYILLMNENQCDVLKIID